MKTNKIENAKLGLFVLAGIMFLIFSLYLIGRNRNMFGATFTIQASFHNVNGLMPGNNVRFAGIDVGTVYQVQIESDTSVLVTMVIDKKSRPYIKKNAIVSVGTDGLMGNKLVNINTVHENAAGVQEGDRLVSVKPVETDAMLRTLNTTNDNIAGISSDLRKITQKINSSSGLWRLLSDSALAIDLRQAAANFNQAGKNAALAGKGVADLMTEAKYGNGLIGTLVVDTTLSAELKISLTNIKRASDQITLVSNDLSTVSTRLKQGEGTAGALLTDSVMLQKLNRSLDNVEQGTDKFNENMKAMRSNFLFRGYFRKQEKKKGDSN